MNRDEVNELKNNLVNTIKSMEKSSEGLSKLFESVKQSASEQELIQAAPMIQQANEQLNRLYKETEGLKSKLNL